MAIDPHTGQVRAIAGGFSFRQSKFNRATQAKRQPGSAFKPFVYLAALEEGYTPASVVLDAPIAIDQGPGLPLWQPENFSERFYGPSTLRLGLEKSRNVMTVRLAQAIGMERVQSTRPAASASREGLGTNLAASLGSNEVDRAQPHHGLRHAGQWREEGDPGPGRAHPGPPRPHHPPPRRAALRRLSDGGLRRPPPPAVPDDAASRSRTRATPTRWCRCWRAWSSAARPRPPRCWAGRSPARPAPPTTPRTPGSSASRPISCWASGSASTSRKSMGDRQTGASLALPLWIEIMRGCPQGRADHPLPHPARRQPGPDRRRDRPAPRPRHADGDRRGLPARHRALPPRRAARGRGHGLRHRPRLGCAVRPLHVTDRTPGPAAPPEAGGGIY